MFSYRDRANSELPVDFTLEILRRAQPMEVSGHEPNALAPRHTRCSWMVFME